MKVAVFQWNVLADKFATPDTFPEVDPEHLMWNHRYPLLIERLHSVAHRDIPSVICLQEVDHFAELMNALEETHTGKWAKKYATRYDDGCAVFIPKSLCDGTEWRTVRLGKKSPHIALVCCTHVGVFVSTHLRAGLDHAQYGPIRRGQVRTLLAVLEEYREVPTVVTGDFNEPPDRPDSAVSIMADAGFALAYGETSLDATHNAVIFLQFLGEFRREPHRLDYIFVRGATVDNVEAFDGSRRMPTAIFPSDHCLLGARIIL